VMGLAGPAKNFPPGPGTRAGPQEASSLAIFCAPPAAVRRDRELRDPALAPRAPKAGTFFSPWDSLAPKRRDVGQRALTIRRPWRPVPSLRKPRQSGGYGADAGTRGGLTLYDSASRTIPATASPVESRNSAFMNGDLKDAWRD